MKNLTDVLPSGVRRTLGVEAATRRGLVGGVLPLWLGAGLADWYRHRQTRIEKTAGARGAGDPPDDDGRGRSPDRARSLCEVNAGVLLTSFAALGAHEVTAYWEQTYAEPRRR